MSAYLAGLNAPLPFYRFTVALGKAVALAELAASFGKSLLEALEKKDIGAVARLRNTQETCLAEAAKEAKLEALEEGKGAVASLRLEKAMIEARRRYFSSRAYMNGGETTGLALASASLAMKPTIALAYLLAGGFHLVPQVLAGAAGIGGSPQIALDWGGEQMSGSLEAVTGALEVTADALDQGADLARTQAEYVRRWDDWRFETEQADAELKICDQDIANAERHNALLQADIDEEDLEVTQLRHMDAFMRAKFTNQERWDWIISTTSKTYHDAYRLAFDVGRQAERALHFELGVDRQFLTFGWNGLKRGLLAADQLVFSLRSMEMAHDRKKRRDYELQKHIPLSQADPQALIQLQATGSCDFKVSEASFDLDHPGHYMRRHKSVSLSILCPAAAEPYASVNCRLSLLRNRYRAAKTLRQGAQNDQQRYAEDAGGDSRFVYDVGSVQSIATSRADADAGLFELDFDDPRYLPFEYTGAIATWRIELPPSIAQLTTPPSPTRCCTCGTRRGRADRPCAIW